MTIDKRNCSGKWWQGKKNTLKKDMLLWKFNVVVLESWMYCSDIHQSNVVIPIGWMYCSDSLQFHAAILHSWIEMWTSIAGSSDSLHLKGKKAFVLQKQINIGKQIFEDREW